jgi:hypothetical protein
VVFCGEYHVVNTDRSVALRLSATKGRGILPQQRLTASDEAPNCSQGDDSSAMRDISASESFFPWRRDSPAGKLMKQ